MEQFIDLLVSHWPFIVFAAICSVVFQVVKATIWTEKNARKQSWIKHFYWWGRKTLPIQPAIVGALIGIIPGMPLSEGMVHTLATGALYYSGAGIASTWLFDVLKSMAKSRGLILGNDS